MERPPDKILRLDDGDRLTIGETVVQIERRGTKLLVCVWVSGGLHVAKLGNSCDNSTATLEIS
jgi:hypothetical protein